MKKTSTTYTFIKKGKEDAESINIKVNEEWADKDEGHPILIEEHSCWRSKANAIDYYKWIIECIKKL